MKLKLVKASRGLVWVRQGLLACRQQPLGYISLLGLTSMAAMLLMLVLQEVGLALVTCLAPSVWMGFMLATRRVLTGQSITPAVMIEPFKSDAGIRRDFALLGLLYGLCMLVALHLSGWLGPDPQALEDIKTNAKDMAEVVSNPLIQQSMLLDLALTLPMTLLFLHAPALILWARVPLGKALFFSAVASWRNLGAFVLFGLGWFGVLSALALAAGLIVIILPIPALVNALTMAASMGLAAAFYGSLYFAVVDCFDPQKPAEPTEPAQSA